MKKALTLLFLLFFLGEIALAYKTTYLRPNRSLYGRNTLYGSNYAPLRSYYNPYRSNYIPRSSYYNPYSTYYSPYNYGGWGVWNNSQALRRFQGFRLLNRFFNGWTMNNNLIALKKDDKGTLTGYSVPVDEDIYNQNGASP